jgi:hypothetical protein
MSYIYQEPTAPSELKELNSTLLRQSDSRSGGDYSVAGIAAWNQSPETIDLKHPKKLPKGKAHGEQISNQEPAARKPPFQRKPCQA